jgi:hypothetical protein
MYIISKNSKRREYTEIAIKRRWKDIFNTGLIETGHEIGSWIRLEELTTNWLSLLLSFGGYIRVINLHTLKVVDF